MLRSSGIAAIVGAFLLASCTQSQVPTTAAVTPKTSATASPSASPKASPVAGSPSPVPPSGNYASPADAGVAGVTATGYGSGSQFCPPDCQGQPQVFGDPSLNAAYVQIALNGSREGTVCFVYTIHDSAGWHYTAPIACPQQPGFNPVLGTADHISSPGGCVNVRQSASLTAKVVGCLATNTLVQIDLTPPRFANGHIWWGINSGLGFTVHDYLIRTSAPTSGSPTAGYGSAADAGTAGVRTTGYGNGCPPDCLGPPQVVGDADPNDGLDAAYALIALQGSRSGTVCYAYLLYDSAGWHYITPVTCPPNAGHNPVLGTSDSVNAPGGCGSLREKPSNSAKQLACLSNGTVVQIDQANPRYADDQIWFAVNGGKGFMSLVSLLSA